MEYIKKDLGAYNLHIIKTDKFKTITLKAYFRSPIVKEEITLRNILCNILLQSSKNYESKRALTIKAQDLYAADIGATNSRLGNYIVTSFYATSLNDKYTEKGNFTNVVEFISDVIFNPDVKENKFNEDKLDIVKDNCINSINSLKEDSSSYSLIRMAEAFDKDSPLSYRMLGYKEDLDKIDSKNLYDYYLKMINNDLVDIFVIGDVDTPTIVSTIKKYFKLRTMKKKKVPYMLENKKPRSRRLFAKETIDYSQSKLAICNTISELSTFERNYALTLYNIILGGSSDSKLFKNVREENSLCYTIKSVPNKLDNILIISAGIDKNNFKKTVDLIETNMQLMKKGKFSDNDLIIAREYYLTALDDILESPSAIIDNYLMMELLGTDTIEEKRTKITEVTKKDIVKVAKKIKMDTVFCLEGVKDENA